MDIYVIVLASQLKVRQWAVSWNSSTTIYLRFYRNLKKKTQRGVVFLCSTVFQQ